MTNSIAREFAVARRGFDEAEFAQVAGERYLRRGHAALGQFLGNLILGVNLLLLDQFEDLPLAVALAHRRVRASARARAT